MALINFKSSVCNYTTSAVIASAAPGSLSTNTYEYIDLEMVPDTGYYLDPSNFSYEQNEYVDYVVFMPDGDNIKARVYLKSFTWPSERTDLQVPVIGCASVYIAPTPPVVPTAPTPTVPVPTPPACPAVFGYFVNKSIIELRGTTRVFKVYGQEGAEFSYTIIDNDNSFTLDTGTKTIPYAGSVDIEIVVPLTTSARVFDVTITTAEACTLQLQNQPSTFKLYQGIDEEWLGDTYECCEEAGVLQSTNCVGYDLYGTYTDGQCGTTNSLIETNSATCGYVPPAPPPTTPPPTTPPPTTPTAPTPPTPTVPTPPTPTVPTPPTPTVPTPPTPTAPPPTVTPSASFTAGCPSSSFTPGQSGTAQVVLQSNVAWTAQLAGAGSSYFSLSPSSGSATSGTTITITYNGSTSFTRDGNILVYEAGTSSPTLTDCTIVYSA